jgi:hypothetical protein
VTGAIPGDAGGRRKPAIGKQILGGTLSALDEGRARQPAEVCSLCRISEVTCDAPLDRAIIIGVKVSLRTGRESWQ